MNKRQLKKAQRRFKLAQRLMLSVSDVADHMSEESHGADGTKQTLYELFPLVESVNDEIEYQLEEFG